MAKPQKPKIDEPTRRIAERLLSMPPKQHKDMKIGKRKAKAGAHPKKRRQPSMDHA
jgi:hypothetical protein